MCPPRLRSEPLNPDARRDHQVLRTAHDDQAGFTLIELLVVIFIIGILAAIALPVFLGQQKKGQDASAKSDARNAVVQVETCFIDERSYAKCNDAADAAMYASEIDWDKITVSTSGIGDEPLRGRRGLRLRGPLLHQEVLGRHVRPDLLARRQGRLHRRGDLVTRLRERRAADRVDHPSSRVAVDGAAVDLPPVTPAPRQLAREDGFALLEVIVSAALLAVMIIAVYTSFDFANRNSGASRSRAVAASLASADQERLRATPVGDLSKLADIGAQAQPDKTIGGVTYTTTSRPTGSRTRARRGPARRTARAPTT